MSAKKGMEVLKQVGQYISKCEGFDRVLKNISFVGGGDGSCIASLIVKPEHLNGGGGLHGGFSSTIVDCITTYALMTHDVENMKTGVSVDLHITFLKGARENDELLITANTIRCGKTLAYLDCEIRNKKCNTLLVRGSHTKYVGGALPNLPPKEK